ncbi:uncharacterized protein BROUX77_000079 [Berkeleyomyces rouxiae]|uniref:uncharacterized protein n=1 Tax=Berkeleyomyces rouxiae TaxID=2035830 RepID=UPI003B7D6227
MAKSTEKLTKTTLSNSSIDSKTSSSSASNKIDKKPTARDETRRTTRLGLSFAQMASQEPRSDDDELLRSPSQHAPVTSSMKVDAGVEDAPVVEIPSTPDSRDSDATTPTPNALDGNLFVFSQAQRDENDTNNTNNTNNNNNDQTIPAKRAREIALMLERKRRRDEQNAAIMNEVFLVLERLKESASEAQLMRILRQFGNECGLVVMSRHDHKTLVEMEVSKAARPKPAHEAAAVAAYSEAATQTPEVPAAPSVLGSEPCASKKNATPAPKANKRRRRGKKAEKKAATAATAATDQADAMVIDTAGDQSSTPDTTTSTTTSTATTTTDDAAAPPAPDTAMADADAPTESPDTWTVVAKRAQKKAADKTTTPAPNTTTTTTTTTAPREKTAVVIVTTPESRASALPQRRVRDAVNRLLGKTAVSAVQRTKAGNILLHAVDSEAVRLMTSNLQRVVKELSCFGACEFTRATSPGSRTHKSSKLCFVIHGVPIEDGFDSLKELPKDMADFNGVKISDSLRWLVVPAKGKQAGSVVVEALTQADYDKCVGKNVNVGGAIVPAVPYVDRKSTTDGPPRL